MTVEYGPTDSITVSVTISNKSPVLGVILSGWRLVGVDSVGLEIVCYVTIRLRTSRKIGGLHAGPIQLVTVWHSIVASNFQK